jgi:glycosyltransferase involved in cell wall biosynthesis
MPVDLPPGVEIFVQNKIGGVQSFFESLSRVGCFAPYAARYVALDCVEDPDTRLRRRLDGAPMEVFSYSRDEYVYDTLARLSHRITPGPGIALTNFGLELACLDVHRRPDVTIFHFTHDEAYVPIALRFAHIVDVFVAHNPYFAQVLRDALPKHRASDVAFLPFGIDQSLDLRRTPRTAGALRIVFVGRLHSSKGVLLLPTLDDHLRQAGVEADWIVLGSGPDRERLQGALGGRRNFAVESPPGRRELLQRAAEGDVLVLPSLLDGTPVALMEGMSVGLVPVVTEFNPGVRWLVPDDAGLVCARNDAACLSAHLVRLARDRPELERRSHAALRHARQQFDMERHGRGYGEALSQWRELKRPYSGPPHRYSGRLDHPLIPRAFATLIRSLKRRRRQQRD